MFIYKLSTKPLQAKTARKKESKGRSEVKAQGVPRVERHPFNSGEGICPGGKRSEENSTVIQKEALGVFSAWSHGMV